MGQAMARKSLPINAIKGPPPKIENEDDTHWEYMYRVPLEDGQRYEIESPTIGSFTITGGSSGSFTIGGVDAYNIANVEIYTVDGHKVFDHDGQVGDLVTIQDNPSGVGGSSVILSSSGNSFRRRRPIPIIAAPWEVIRLTGDRDFIITGEKAHLAFNGTGTVTVNGGLWNLKHEGEGNVMVNGDVSGMVNVSEITSWEGLDYIFKVGTVSIQGDVEGQVVQIGGGRIDIKGELKGTVHQTGNGEIFANNGKWKGGRNVQMEEEGEEKEQSASGEAYDIMISG